MTETFGKFKRTKLLGAGGMGEVWKAWDGQLGRWVALKFLKGGSPELIARFRREAQIASRLTHPNIAAIYEVGPNFIAMQFVEGTTLKPGKHAAKLISVAARAVHFAHEQGIVHRDIKPDNLMVTAEGHLFVMDFGLARPTEGKSDISQSGMLVGTPQYMPPEQAKGERVDARADVYSLGATLYELLARRKPFDGGNVLEILTKVVEEEPPHLHGVDPDLETIVLKCLEKEKGSRYPDADALADDLDRYLKGDAISARPSSAPERLRRFLRRRKTLLLAGAAGLLVAIVVAVVVLPKLAHEAQGRREADAALSREKEKAASLAELGTLWSQIVLAKGGLYKATADPRRVMSEIREAVTRVGDYIRRHPDQPQAYYVRSRGNLYLNSLGAAREDLETSIRLNDRFAPGHALLARVLLEEYRARFYQESTDSPDQRRRVTESAEPLLNLAREHLRKGWSDAVAERSIAQWGLVKTREDDIAERLVEFLRISYVDLDVDRAVNLVTKANADLPSEEFCSLLGALATRIDDRIAWQSRALDLMPHYGKALLDRAIGWLATQNIDRAIADLDRAIEIHPDVAVARYNRAFARQFKRNHAGVIEDCTEALRLDPRFFTAANARGMARGEQGDLAGAIEDFTLAVSINPAFGIGYCNRGHARNLTGDVEGAMEDFTKAIEASPWMDAAYVNRSASRFEKEDFDGVIEDCTKAIEINPRQAQAYFNRAEAHLRKGRPAAAIQDYRKALEVAPANWPMRATAQENLAALKNQ